VECFRCRLWSQALPHGLVDSLLERQSSLCMHRSITLHYINASTGRAAPGHRDARLRLNRLAIESPAHQQSARLQAYLTEPQVLVEADGVRILGIHAKVHARYSTLAQLR